MVEAKACDLVTVGSWKILTSRIIYMHHVSLFPLPKIEMEAGFSFKVAWRRICNSALSSSGREILYLLVHNKLPVQERMFRIRLASDPYCVYCLDAVFNDVEHFFCKCCRVSLVWDKVRTMLLGLWGVDSVKLSDLEIISLLFTTINGDKESVWLIGNYVGEVWEELHVRGGSGLREDQFFGFLRFKYKMAQECGPLLGFIPGL